MPNKPLIDDGGQAFPTPPVVSSGSYSDLAHPGNDGMSLRDWFAGMIMCGFSGNPHDEIRMKTPAQLAESAYARADELLKARQQLKK